ncbi:MAG: hypothetical protein H7Y36_01560 [Armatimonadetes bacterium]|nr:hypothetical protein [Akkermansiaceae bacterium]
MKNTEPDQTLEELFQDLLRHIGCEAGIDTADMLAEFRKESPESSRLPTPEERSQIEEAKKAITARVAYLKRNSIAGMVSTAHVANALSQPAQWTPGGNFRDPQAN